MRADFIHLRIGILILFFVRYFIQLDGVVDNSRRTNCGRLVTFLTTFWWRRRLCLMICGLEFGGSYFLDAGAEDVLRPHAIICLLGRLKSEIGERFHMQVMARVTKSGVPAGVWSLV